MIEFLVPGCTLLITRRGGAGFNQARCLMMAPLVLCRELVASARPIVAKRIGTESRHERHGVIDQERQRDRQHAGKDHGHEKICRRARRSLLSGLR